jgi:hypothetical protein
MSETDNHIDHIFKNKLKEAEEHIPFQETDWLALKERLDHQSKPVSWKRIVSMAAVILVFIISTVLIYNSLNKRRDSSISTSKSNITLSKPQKPDIAPSISSKNSKDTKSYTDKASKNNLSANNYEHSTLSSQPVKINQMQLLRNSMAFSSVPVFKIPVLSYSDNIPFKSIKNVMTVDKKNETIGPVSITDVFNNKNWNNFTLSLIASTDLNGAGNFHYNSVGGDIGIILSSKIIGRWSISAGAIYAKKPYKIPYSRYRTTENNPLFQVNPDEVRADCRVLDIPVNLHYTLISKKNHRLLLGTGISSYFMLKENYYFQYSNTYNNTSSELSLTNQNRHWFSVINIQATYERRLAKNFSLGFEPYIKLPINNIGYGQVKLQSIGIALKISWGFHNFK